MKLEFKPDFDRALRELDGFSERRLRATIATALTRTVVQDMRPALYRELVSSIDRPTPYTQSALRYLAASATRLEAYVGFDIERITDARGTTTGFVRGGTPASNYLSPQVEGGGRRLKRFEVALKASGALPDGWLAVPGEGAALDAYGNMSRGQIIQILSQLRIQLVAGTSRNMSFDARKQITAQRKAGGRFFVVKPGGSKQPGVYQREFIGRGITPVVIFVRSAVYRPRYRFDAGDRVGREAFPRQLARAIAEQRARLAARGR